MKTIIIATDFSDNAWKAASFGASFHRTIPCHFVILHAYHVPSSVMEVNVSSIIADRSKEVSAELIRFQESFEQLDHHDESTFQYISRYGEVSSTLMEVSKEKFSELLILGTRGSTNNWSFAFGSTTAELISSSPLPILAIPSESTLDATERIMLATDYENFTNVDTLAPLRDIAITHDAEVMVVHVEKEENNETSIEQGMEGLVLHRFFGEIRHAYFDVVDKDIDNGLLTFAEQNEVDLIVLVNREKSIWKRIFQGSVSVKMGLYSQVPLLILRD